MLGNAAAARQLCVAVGVALDIAGQAEPELAGLLLDADAAGDRLRQRFIDGSGDETGGGGALRGQAVAEGSARDLILAERHRQACIDPGRRLGDVLPGD